MIQCLADLQIFLLSAKASGAKDAVVQFWNREEVQHMPHASKPLM